MLLNHVQICKADQDRMAELETALLEYDKNPELIRTYHEHAVATGQIERARNTFDGLQACYPNDNRIRSLNIALCLKQQDYTKAMQEIETLMSVGTPDDGLIDAALGVRSRLGPMTIGKAAKAGTTVSLCMIVKNEIANIGACLNIAKALADEMIVVDTGSADRTADVATVFGARVFTYTWNDDFSAARNFSLEQATGDWVLVLDADEMIASKDHASLMQQIAEYAEKPVAFSIMTRNYTHLANAFQWRANDGSYPGHEAGLGWIPSHKVRLFPRMKSIRFRYPVHERVDPSIKEANIPIEDCQIPVHHYGDLNEGKKQRKAKVYFDLGFAKLNSLDQNLEAIRELAIQAGQLERWTEAIELWQRLLNKHPNFTEAYVNMSSAYWQMAQYEKAFELAQRAMKIDSSLREARYNTAVCLLFFGKILEAIDILKNLKIDHPDYLAARFMLAAANACIGDVKRGAREFQLLRKTRLGQVVQMAIGDFANRLEESGLKEYARRVKLASKRLTLTTN
jgi:glycosyltransferase involved in cell wall biosynthesis